MKKIGLRTLIIYGLACLSGIMLLYTSQSVQKAEDRLAVIEVSAQSEDEAIRVLRAEWAYLNSPARLETLAEDFLSLDKPDPSRIVTEPSYLPEIRSLDTEAPLYREISLEPSIHEESEPQALPESVPAEIVPPKKPAQPKRKTEKSFDKLLGELSDGGEQ